MEDDTHLPTKVSPFATQANFPLSALPTICFGAKTPKDDVCVLRDGEQQAPPTNSSHPRLLLMHACMHTCVCIWTPEDQSDCVPVCGCGPGVTAVCQGPCSLVQMAQPVAPMVPKLPTFIDQGRGSHGLGNMDLLVWFGLWGLWGLFGGLGSPSRDSQDNRSALTQLPPTIYQSP